VKRGDPPAPRNDVGLAKRQMFHWIRGFKDPVLETWPHSKSAATTHRLGKTPSPGGLAIRI